MAVCVVGGGGGEGEGREGYNTVFQFNFIMLYFNF